MISGLFFVNQKGEVLISRFYRDDVSRQAVDAFRLEVIVAKNVGVPVIHLDNSSFMYTRQGLVFSPLPCPLSGIFPGDLYIVAVTKSNSNCTLVFQFLYKLVEVFKAYFGGVFEENSVRENFVLIYELLDETMDHGYPQITAVNLLTGYIKIGNVQDVKITTATDQITSEITGAVDWRQPNKYKYRKNEVFLDVLEAVNLLMSNKGSVLKSDVSGKIVMKTYLTGMPECKFGLNDKLVMEKEAKSNVNKKRHGSGIAIDDITFHRCVRLGQFDQDRTISFIPPDGEFELMKYRITQNVNLPFKVIPVINEHGTTRVEYELKVKGNFSSKLFATNVQLKIPTPKNTAKAKMTVTAGKAKYHPELSCIIWKIKKFPGDASYILKGEVKILASIEEKAWSRPPVVMEFQVPMFTASGLHVRFLKVFERGNYQTIKWVRYITRAGSYQIRI